MAAVGMEGAGLALEVHTSSSLRRITNSKDRIVTPGEQHTARDGCSVSPSIQSDKVDVGERGVARERGGSGDGGDTAAYVPLVWPLAWHPTDKGAQHSWRPPCRGFTARARDIARRRMEIVGCAPGSESGSWALTEAETESWQRRR